MKNILLIFMITIVFVSGSILAASDEQKMFWYPYSDLTIELYTDFQDPFTAKWYEETLPEIQEAYLSGRSENGTVSILFKHFIIASHDNALPRAKAVECAAEQDQLFNFVDTFFKDLDKIYTYDDFEELVDFHVLDKNKFNECYNNVETESKIISEMDEGVIRGVKGIPHFFINGRIISGSQPFEKFVEAIEEELKSPSCRETDGGKDYYNKGEVKSSEDFIIDSCLQDSEDQLIESYCSAGVAKSLQYTCENGCQDGVCIIEPKPKYQNKGYRYAHWECYDGENQDFNDDTSCKLVETWKGYATEFCEGRCYEDDSKCGVNSFGVSLECYYDGPVIIEEPIQIPENPIIIEEPEIIDEISLCRNSCPSDDKCYPFGYRKSGEYCSDKGEFVSQLESNFECDNNFECSSNVCVSGNCISESFIQKIINWFKRLFG